MGYQLVVPKSVQKEIEKIDNRYKQRILAALVSLEKDPFLGKKLGGARKYERSYEVWPYRIIYHIKESELIILVVKVGHRQGVY